MKNKILILLSYLLLCNACYSQSTDNIDFYGIQDSNLLYSSNNADKVYIWLKLAGNSAQGDAVSGGCDILFTGIKKQNSIEGKTLNYHSNINQSNEINNESASIAKNSIVVGDDKIYEQCGMNIVYGKFNKMKNNSKLYQNNLQEIMDDNLNDVKENKKPNSEAYSNLINNLSCTSIINNINKINDIGYYLEQKNLLNDSELILRKVINCSPNRTVAYLNLGDVLLKKTKTKEAEANYEKYVDLMKASKLDKKIPQRVLTVIKGK